MRKSFLHSKPLRTEISQFFLFTAVLLFFSVFFAGLRVEHRSLLYADSGITAADLQSVSSSDSFTGRLIAFTKGILTGNPGETVSGESVSAHLLKRFLPTLHLAVFSVFTGAGLAILVSLAGVYFRKEWFTSFWIMVCNIILSTPVFVAAILLLILFFSILNILPPGGYENGSTMYVILPGAALGTRVFGRMVLFVNDEAYSEYKSQYIMVLRTRGFSESRIIFHHIFRKIFPVLIVYILLDFSSLLSGAMIVEEIFFFPGIGKSMFAAIKNMDVNLLQALLFYTGMIFYLFNRAAIYMQKRLKGNSV